MRKIFFVLAVVIAIIAVVGLIVSAQLNDEIGFTEEDIEDVIKDVSSEGVPTQIYEYVSNFVQKRNVLPSEISFIKEVDFDSLPKSAHIENVGENNLAIYEISYNEGNQEDQVYVITYSVEELQEQGDLIIAHDKRQFLNFGFAGAMGKSGFLKTSTEVETSLEKGYVMVRDGSITAVSTNLEVFQSNQGEIEIIVYRNGEPIGFGNVFSTASPGIKKDYNIQSKDIVTFKAGDVISVYLKANGTGVVWGDVITMIEITTTS
ncbi:MAG TPA: hypothetical protein VMV95_01125 [Bacillota bacterium]|nr:hypothetical protein [Bacillota bacterium]